MITPEQRFSRSEVVGQGTRSGTQRGNYANDVEQAYERRCVFNHIRNIVCRSCRIGLCIGLAFQVALSNACCRHPDEGFPKSNKDLIRIFTHCWHLRIRDHLKDIVHCLSKICRLRHCEKCQAFKCEPAGIEPQAADLPAGSFSFPATWIGNTPSLPSSLGLLGKLPSHSIPTFAFALVEARKEYCSGRANSSFNRHLPDRVVDGDRCILTPVVSKRTGTYSDPWLDDGATRALVYFYKNSRYHCYGSLAEALHSLRPAALHSRSCLIPTSASSDEGEQRVAEDHSAHLGLDQHLDIGFRLH